MGSNNESYAELVGITQEEESVSPSPMTDFQTNSSSALRIEPTSGCVPGMTAREWEQYIGSTACGSGRSELRNSRFLDAVEEVIPEGLEDYFVRIPFKGKWINVNKEVVTELNRRHKEERPIEKRETTQGISRERVTFGVIILLIYQALVFIDPSLAPRFLLLVALAVLVITRFDVVLKRAIKVILTGLQGFADFVYLLVLTPALRKYKAREDNYEEIIKGLQKQLAEKK